MKLERLFPKRWSGESALWETKPGVAESRNQRETRSTSLSVRKGLSTRYDSSNLCASQSESGLWMCFMLLGEFQRRQTAQFEWIHRLRSGCAFGTEMLIFVISRPIHQDVSRSTRGSPAIPSTIYLSATSHL